MTATDGSDPAPNVWRLVVVWWMLSVIGVLLMIFVVGPHIPPGSATSQAHEQHRANVIISAILTPIAQDTAFPSIGWRWIGSGPERLDGH